MEVLEVEERLRRRRRWIGQYIAAVAVYQCLLAVGGRIFAPLSEPALYLTPRFWTVFLTEAGMSWPYGASLFAGLLSLAVGWRLAAAPTATMLWVALAVESLLALPSVLFLGIVFLANMSPAHGLSRAEVVIPLAIFAIASGAPLAAGVWVHRVGNRRPAPPW